MRGDRIDVPPEKGGAWFLMASEEAHGTGENHFSTSGKRATTPLQAR